jgi:hypothetical protein
MKPRQAHAFSLVAALALAASSLAIGSPAAQAAPVFTTSTLTSSSFAHDDATCTESLAVEQPSAATAVIENGGATTASSQASVTATAVDPTDVMTGAASMTATASVSSSGTDLTAIDHVGQGTVNVTSTKPLSACDLHMLAVTELDFDFTVASPGFLTVKIAHKGGSYTEFYLQSETPDDSASYDEYTSGIDLETSRRLYLPAGTYSGYTVIDAGVVNRSTALAGPVSASIHATFAHVGTQSVPAAGKGKKYVTLPAARSCATHALTPSVVGKKKKAEQVKQVAFYVNDAKVKTVKHPKKGASVSLPVADNLDAELRAVVQLLPKKKGHPGKELEVSSSYLACSA